MNLNLYDTKTMHTYAVAKPTMPVDVTTPFPFHVIEAWEEEDRFIFTVSVETAENFERAHPGCTRMAEMRMPRRNVWPGRDSGDSRTRYPYS